MNAMRLPVKGEEGREKGAPGLLFGLRLAKTLFVSAEPLPTDGFTLPSSPFTLPAIASCDCLRGQWYRKGTRPEQNVEYFPLKSSEDRH